MTNEPTTGEIVNDLRQCSTHFCEEKCNRYYTLERGNNCAYTMMSDAADRLESQAKQIAELTAAIKTQSDLCRECASLTVIEQKAEIDALTARAESAERERDAAITDMQDNCQYCVGYEREADEPPCSTCYNARTFELNDVQRTKNWKWRGLQPQDGGGK